MKKLYILLLSLFMVTACTRHSQPDHGYPISPVSFTDIELQDQFWSKRIATNRQVTIPFGFKKCKEEGRIRNFAKAGGLVEGDYEGVMPFDDSDVYKIIEGASYSLQTHPDAQLEKYIDDIITKIAAAQEKDGYLSTWKTIDPDTTPAWWVKVGPRWHDLGSSHELYNAGHLYEAAFAHYRATGKKTLLNIALKNADLIAETFGPTKLTTPPGHQIIETGLIKLYRATGTEKYLDLAKFFLDIRGDSTTHVLFGAYSQDHKPIVEQKTAVGHAVRALYMYAAMADVAAMLKDDQYLHAVDRLWADVVSSKLYITGGIGARHEGESFGEAYELPNLTSYNETCAAIANVYWNHRMFLLHGDAKYLDVLERTLYNGLISGVSLQGDAFFYPNCLTSDGEYRFNRGALTRQPWFDCSCCPSNIMRFMPSVPDYIYAQQDDKLFVNLYMSSNAHINIAAQDITLHQQTEYPWDGKIVLQVETDQPVSFVLNIRIPGWVGEQPVPSDLYHFVEKPKKYSLKLNDSDLQPSIENGYAVIDRRWMNGDLLELDFPMPVRRIIADARVQDDIGKVALQRGPIVYCAEWIDNQGGVLDLALPDDAEFQIKETEMLDGITVVQTQAVKPNGSIERLTAIPYYAWSHRGAGEMTVWLNRYKK